MNRVHARGWVRYAGKALLNALCYPRCDACGLLMNTMPFQRLCGGCELARQPNDGPRCVLCDVPCTAPQRAGGAADAGTWRGAGTAESAEHSVVAGGMCRRCQRLTPPFARLRAPWLYGGAVADVLKRGKFHGLEGLIVGAAHSIVWHEDVTDLARVADMIVPVPLGRQRLRQRGFNQSALIARIIGRRHRRLVRHALRRIRETTPQSALSLADRAANMQQAFAPRLSLSGTALLVDDVVTSGETVSHAARALLDAGIHRVMVLAVARAPDPSWNEQSHA